MVFVLLTYGGWNEASYLSAEVVSPGRNRVRGLVWSILIVTGLYLLVNWAYLRGLGHAGVAASTAVAADLVKPGGCPFPCRRMDMKCRGLCRGALFLGMVLLAATVGIAATKAKPKEYVPKEGQDGKDVVWIPTRNAVADKMLDLA
jgi:amino acid transporter